MRSVVFAIVALAAATASAQETIRVFAASSLTDALSTVLVDFEDENPSIRVVTQFGGSSDLARQILAGAPADVFFSADHRQMDRVVTKARADILSNELVIVRHRDARAGAFDLGALGRIALADPEAVPAGVYAREYLERRGVWSRLRGKVVPTLDVRGALAAVASGNVDAGFVYRTDAAIEPRVEVVFSVPRDRGPNIVYPLGLLEDRGRAVYEHLTSRAAGEIFERFGFVALVTE